MTSTVRDWGRFVLHLGDCRASMAAMPEASVDAIVCDPPYELTAGKKGGTGVASVNLDSPYGRSRIGTGNGSGGFMGMKWDSTGVAFDPETWRQALRVLKPGGYLLAFSGTRTYHRMVCAIEDGGFEIRDQIGWAFGSGFPKSHNGEWGGTALKPAWEPICVARKPLIGTVEANWREWGTGALNIDACRVPTDDDLNGGAYSVERKPSGSAWVQHGGTIHNSTGRDYEQPVGRWPANLIHDGSDEVLAAFPQAPGQIADASSSSSSSSSRKTQNVYGAMTRGSGGGPARVELDKSAARFFYCAKTSKADRGEGNTHPTVKPTDLMRYLCRLVTPRGGLVLDPFLGSGSTGKAAMLEDFRFVGCDLSSEYIDIAERRIATAWLGDLAYGARAA